MVALFSEKEQCCGCTACAAACPKNAISMVSDEAGFVYPSIDGSLCVECGLCLRTCSFKKAAAEQTDCGKSEVYAAFSRNCAIHNGSSSGGVFAELAGEFILDGGVVYGAAFDDDFKVRHIRVDNSDGIKRLCGSKYVQSDLDNVFVSVLDDLKNGLKVLFSGTGCQIDGLKGFLKKDYDKLFTVDILCRGVPSPKMFEDYKAYLENKYSSRLVSFTFRAKKIKGEIQDIEAVFENGKRYSEYPDMDSYRGLYSQCLTFRNSCYQCRYACKQRVGDITLGDFWGIEKTMPEFKERNGNSLIILSTQKGKGLFNFLSDRLNVRKSEMAAALQPSLTAPAQKPDKADELMKDYVNHGFEYICKKYNSIPTLKRLKRKIKSMM